MSASEGKADVRIYRNGLILGSAYGQERTLDSFIRLWCIPNWPGVSALPGRHWNSVRNLYSKSHRFVSCRPWCRDLYDSDVVKGRPCRIKFRILPNRYEFRVTDGIGRGGPFNIDGVSNRFFASRGGMILVCQPSPGPAQASDLCRPVGDSFECDLLS